MTIYINYLFSMYLIYLSTILTTIRCCMQTMPDMTTTEKPPLPIPPCAMCPEAGFYNASLCPPTEHDGCVGVPTENAIMNITTSKGCLEVGTIMTFIGCSLCESSIITNDGCLEELVCTDPISFTYLGGGLDCKTFVVECNEEELLFLGLGGDEMPSAIAVERADIETTLTFSCSSNSQWTVTFLKGTLPPRSVTNIRCANFAPDIGR
uniref:C6 domain-containing protein n=1 Tax=Heterorhabditis bacteriophora TaxID=37862 RepID=A0A1I7XFT5_HETBA